MRKMKKIIHMSAGFFRLMRHFKMSVHFIKTDKLWIICDMHRIPIRRQEKIHDRQKRNTTLK